LVFLFLIFLNIANLSGLFKISFPKSTIFVEKLGLTSQFFLGKALSNAEVFGSKCCLNLVLLLMEF